MLREQRSLGVRSVWCALAVCVSITFAAREAGALEEHHVLVLYNSQNADSQAVRDLYVARHPGVREFDLNDATLAPGDIARADYLSKIHDPLKDHLNGVTSGDDISADVIVILTTRGLPARVSGNFEFNADIISTWASVESELVLLQQDLEATGSGNLNRRYWGAIDNPYHRLQAQSLDGFDRSGIKDPLPFQTITLVGTAQAWRVNGLTAGQMYFPMRLDAAPTGVGTGSEVTAVEHIAMLLERSMEPVLSTCDSQALLDEYPPAGEQLDDDSAGALFPGGQDYEQTNSVLVAQGVPITHDETTNFVTGPELVDQGKTVGYLATYGENHDLNGAGDNPPGNGTYIDTYVFSPGAIFTSIESFNGNALIDGTQRSNQESILDFISAGGSFTVGSVAEPFTFTIPDNDMIARNFIQRDMQWVEAVYSAIPAVGWQWTPVGDPLATLRKIDTTSLDLNGDHVFDAEDVYAYHASPVDIDCDSVVTDDDAAAMRDGVRWDEIADVSEDR